MTDEERRRVVDLCRRAQRGLDISREEYAFLMHQAQENPEAYRDAHDEAWDDNAAALGSWARKRRGERR